MLGPLLTRLIALQHVNLRYTRVHDEGVGALGLHFTFLVLLLHLDAWQLYVC